MSMNSVDTVGLFSDSGKLVLALIFQLIGLVLAVIADPYIQKKQRTILLAVAALALSLMIQNRAEYCFLREKNHDLVCGLFRIYAYSVRPLMIVLFLKVIDTEKNRRFLWILVIANAAACLVAFLLKSIVNMSVASQMRSWPEEACSFTLCTILLTVLLRESFLRYRTEKALDFAIPLINALFMAAAIIMDWTQLQSGTINFLTITIVSSCLFYYFWLHLHFSREHEQAMEAEQRIQIMISQIQPHFLYNTLSTIQALCRIDPEKASETTEKFGTYLRMNIDSLNQASLIPFRQELEHTKTYADIEMMRFPYIHISYDIEEEKFSIPALSIQPIVENAIRHGVRGQYNGLIRIASGSDENDYIVTVKDNGRGFRPEDLTAMDEKHIGIRNVRERIVMLCRGSLEIESGVGKGTKVIIRIPKGEEIR